MSIFYDFLFTAFTDTFVGLMLAMLTVPINVFTEALLRLLPAAP